MAKYNSRQLTRVDGVAKWVNHLRRHRAQAAKGVERGLKKGGLYVQRESMKVVPVDTGNLRGGAFTRASGSGFRTEVFVGYLADYAIYVHEITAYAHGEEYNRKYAKEIAATQAQGRDAKGRYTGASKNKTKVWQRNSSGEWRQNTISRGFHARGVNQKAKFLTDVLTHNPERQNTLEIITKEITKSIK